MGIAILSRILVLFYTLIKRAIAPYSIPQNYWQAKCNRPSIMVVPAAQIVTEGVLQLSAIHGALHVQKWAGLLLRILVGAERLTKLKPAHF
ncbi:MAG: hypothetical protein SAK29_03555 [Scytonema sp. PMC 1069.18]|nr:hypothetical protein [Scytonema sp. PMC 1069.18]MEC4881043.1 hypothetical protein [Scytonema sp. PMC 1070.18]